MLFGVIETIIVKWRFGYVINVAWGNAIYATHAIYLRCDIFAFSKCDMFGVAEREIGVNYYGSKG